MTLDRVLAIIGIVLGIPAVVALVLSANQSLQIFIVILAALLVGAALYIRYILNAPPYTFREATVTLSFPNDHETAILTKTYHIIPNLTDLRQMEHKNIAADGQIQNICWNDQPVPQDRIVQRLGEYEILIDFPISPRKWKEFAGKLSYECLGSFRGNPESMLYCVDFPTREARIIVEFPPTKRCRSAEARKLQGSGQIPVKRGPEISSDGRRLELHLKRPTFGAHYAIYWTW